MHIADSIQIRPAHVTEIRALRLAVLRSGMPPESAVFHGDDEPDTHHLGAFTQDGQNVGCATLVRRPWHGESAWQLRGMAVRPDMHGRGIGRRLLQAVDQIVNVEPPPRTLWCNARTPAVPFYRCLGWDTVGDEFIIETAGPHFRMIRELRTGCN